jgi:uncharacterized spore protein YtfJ
MTMQEHEGATTLIERIAEVIGARAGAPLVYGAPIEREGVTVVPVARVRYGFGAGMGTKPGAGDAAAQEGGGGGGRVIASPAGFVVVQADEVTYHPIRDPARLVGLVAAIAAGMMFAIRAIARARR